MYNYLHYPLIFLYGERGTLKKIELAIVIQQHLQPKRHIHRMFSSTKPDSSYQQYQIHCKIKQENNVLSLEFFQCPSTYSEGLSKNSVRISTIRHPIPYMLMKFTQ